MFSRKKKKTKEQPQRKARSRPNAVPDFENQFGVPTASPDDAELEAELRALTGINSLGEESLSLDENDCDLEAELLALVGASPNQSKQRLRPLGEEKNMSALPIKDFKVEIPDDFSDNEDGSADEDDPELLSELLELTTEKADKPEPETPSGIKAEETESRTNEEPNVLTILMSRMEMYKEAEIKAKQSNESARARRFNRGIKTLEKLIKSARAGETVLMQDIPPLIATNLKPVPISEVPSSNSDDPQVPMENIAEAQTKETNQIKETINESTRFVEPFDNKLKRTESDDNEPFQKHTIASSVRKTKDNLDAQTNIVSTPKLLEPFERKLKITESDDTEPSEKPTVAPKIRKRVDNPDAQDSTVHIPKPHPRSQNINPNLNINDKLIDNSEDSEVMKILYQKRDHYKSSALEAKKSGNMESALENVKLVKQIDSLIMKAENGEVVKISDIPGIKSSVQPSKSKSVVSPNEHVPVPTTVLQALEQRLKKYLSLQQEAEKVKDGIAARRNARIVKQYAEAIKLHKSGKPIPKNLPTPSGYPPIPVSFQL